MSEKSDAEFESWWYASKYCQVVNSSENAKQTAWDGWNASRELLVIELPESGIAAEFKYSTPVMSRDAVLSAHEAAGLKVKTAA